MRIGVRILGGFVAALGLVVLAGGVGLFSMAAVDSIVSRITGQIFPKITAVVQVEERALEAGLQAQRFLNKRDEASKAEMMKALERLYGALDGFIEIARQVNDTHTLDIAQRARRDAQAFADVSKRSLAAIDDNAKADARLRQQGIAVLNQATGFAIAAERTEDKATDRGDMGEIFAGAEVHKIATRIERQAFEMRISEKNHLLYGLAEDYEAVKIKGADLLALLREAEQRRPPAELAERLAALRSVTQDYLRLVTTWLQNEEILKDGLRELDTAIQAIVRTVNEARETAWSRASETSADAVRTSTWSQRVTVVVAVLAAGLLTLLTILVSRSIAPHIVRLTAAMNGLAAGNQTVEIPCMERRDEIGDMARAADVFKRLALRTDAQHRLKTAVAELASALQQTETHRDFAQTLIQGLVPLLNGGHGVFYIWDREAERLSLLGTYGYKQRKSLSNSFTLGEALVGQCALERKPIVLTDVPDDYVRIGSGLGEAPPRRIVAAPMCFKDTLLGVVEIASFQEFTEFQQSLLDELLPVAALVLENLDRTLKTQALLGETQRQAMALRESEEALTAQQAELKTTNEELRLKSQDLADQAEELKASEEELRSQREELQAINEELTEKTAALEEQQLALETARAEAEGKAQELSRASQYKSEFLANMSHELRTPLNSMLILSKMLADNDEGNLNGEQIESAKIVHESGSHLLRLINDILDLSKVEAGKMDIRLEDVAVRAVAGTLARQFGHVAEAKGLGLQVEVSPDLPEMVRTDGGKLDQIITNMVGNALKFSEQGRVHIRFGRVQEPDGRPPMLSVAVADTGIGIPADKLGRVFGAFEQADGTTSRRYGGTGLGLSISQKLAKLLGGEIVVHSEPGQGSTFTLRIPLTAADAAEAAGTAPPAGAPAVVRALDAVAEGQPDGNQSLILVIEDDPVFTRVLVDFAAKRGFRTVAAADGETGLRLAAEHRPSGIILDVGLPDMDGWAVIDRLKDDAQLCRIPVHFISASGEQEKGLLKGAASFLTKPVSKEQLETLLDRLALPRGGTSKGKRVLVVDSEPDGWRSAADLLRNEAVDVIGAASGEEALAILGRTPVDGIVLDLDLPDTDGATLLERARAAATPLPAIIVHSRRPLSKDESLRLREYTDSIIVQGGRSQERLLDEVKLFLHSVKVKLPEEERHAMALAGTGTEDVFRGRAVLVVDDDMRNAFALSRVLRARGLKVLIAQDGQKALDQLEANPQVDIVLMDIMMPGMDGYETTRAIRKQRPFAQLPILALTAKAMKGDRELCLEAGANDYLSKPIDTERLLSMMRVWLGAH
ncbi:response regulator [Azospirillum sp. TSO22-1]|uniref:response regulator n=1 Tax=Azospirillum sp. TSO22-1 TaxID=716789 RepID=UPI000D651AE3|nr:response regulator [Azospirillum sp. TSO22-1]